MRAIGQTTSIPVVDNFHRGVEFAQRVPALGIFGAQKSVKQNSSDPGLLGKFA